ncbi:MAG: hypothetical protein JWQ10_367 [Herbaspirillum sp.]|nr:hypothetical protein [Herbaspirillum sp.]
MFESLDFSSFNEADVREEVLAPLLRFLGYRSGTENGVIRELPLVYPKQFLGRKEPNKDPVLRGRADYILDVQKKINWVLEAKSAFKEIEKDDIEQAYSYANHAEVRAIYFALCNGHEFLVFQTNRGPASDPILKIAYAEFNNRHHRLTSLLSPESIIRDHPDIKVDLGNPLGKELRSLERIGSGRIVYRPNPQMPKFDQVVISIVEGVVQRNDAGKISAYMRTVAPFVTLQKLGEQLNIDSFEMICEDKFLSSDPNAPSLLRCLKELTFPAGSILFNVEKMQDVTLLADFSVSCIWEASGFLQDHKFLGTLRNHMTLPDGSVREGFADFHLILG